MADQTLNAEGELKYSPFSRKAEFSGFVFSMLLHMVILAILGLLVIATKTTREALITDVAFQDFEEPESLAFDVNTDIQIDDVAPTTSSVMNLTSVFDATQAVDLHPTGLEPIASSTNLGEAAGDAAKAAAGIRKRVKAAGGATGEVQFSLSWMDRNDLDLHVIAPSGERIFYRQKQSHCHGRLDVDMNSTPSTDEPVENTRWMGSNAPEGRYTVLIHFFKRHDNETNVPFQLLAKLNNKSDLVDGISRGYNSLSVHRFIHVPQRIKGSQRAIVLKRYQQLQRSEERIASSKLKVARRKNNQGQFRIIAGMYPHTDAGLTALRLLTGGSGKFSR